RWKSIVLHRFAINEGRQSGCRPTRLKRELFGAATEKTWENASTVYHGGTGAKIASCSFRGLARLTSALISSIGRYSPPMRCQNSDAYRCVARREDLRSELGEVKKRHDGFSQRQLANTVCNAV
ncbi:MAG: hypothetical protein AAF961_04330, partial [Planctomycetota bacterium]